MAFRARKLSGVFEKRAPVPEPLPGLCRRHYHILKARLAGEIANDMVSCSDIVIHSEASHSDWFGINTLSSVVGTQCLINNHAVHSGFEG